MDIIDATCLAMRAQPFESLIVWAGYFGYGLVGGCVSLLLIAHGYWYNNERTKKAGVAAAIALIIAGTAAELLKHFAQLPRPKDITSSGFPSGHTSAAFSLASVLGITFPALSPLFYFLAILTGVSRLYLRAHFTTDVIGGAVIGLLTGISVGRKMIPAAAQVSRSPLNYLGWLGSVAVAAGALLFFHFVENNIQAHMRPTVVQPADARNSFTLDFGTPQARGSLRSGWSWDESWKDGTQSIVWADSLTSVLTLNLPAALDYRFRLYVLPYSPRGLTCQRLKIKVNDAFVSDISLEKGWHWYEFQVPSRIVKAGSNSVEFFYAYTETPKRRQRIIDPRTLAVAFDILQAIPGS
jgi:membrane-associated phospholipid phosphatase